MTMTATTSRPSRRTMLRCPDGAVPGAISGAGASTRSLDTLAPRVVCRWLGCRPLSVEPGQEPGDQPVDPVRYRSRLRRRTRRARERARNRFADRASARPVPRTGWSPAGGSLSRKRGRNRLRFGPSKRPECSSCQLAAANSGRPRPAPGAGAQCRIRNPPTSTRPGVDRDPDRVQAVRAPGVGEDLLGGEGLRRVLGEEAGQHAVDVDPGRALRGALRAVPGDR